MKKLFTILTLSMLFSFIGKAQMYEVIGAGNPMANGIYTPTGMSNIDGNPVWSNEFMFMHSSNTSEWVISMDPINPNIMADYRNFWIDPMTPPLSGWMIEMGVFPEPTVTIYICDLVASAVVDSNTTCNGFADGGATASAIGGTSPYYYTWNNSATTASITGVTAATYNVTITDKNGCMDNSSVNILGYTDMSKIDFVNDASSYGGNDGSIDITISNGVAPYTYSWVGPSSFMSSDEDIIDLFAGKYYLTVSDYCGAELIDSIVISQPDYCIDNLYVTGCIEGDDIGTFSFANISNPTMFDQCIGGTTGYSDYTNMKIIVAPGNKYQIAIGTSNPNYEQGFGIWIDYNFNHEYEVDEFVWASPGISMAPNVFYGEITIPISAQPGITRLRARALYNQSPSAFDACLNWDYGEAEEYSIEILDCNGLAAGITSTTNATCFGGSDGEITVLTIGGNSPINFAWSNSETTQNVSNLSAGKYIVSITDNVGCLIIDSTIVNEPTKIQIDVTSNDASCGNSDGNASLLVSNAVLPYTVDWGILDSLALPAGTHSVGVQDANFCFESTSFIINNIGGASVTVNTTPTLCNGDNTGKATLNITGGILPYTVDWGGIDSNNISAGTYNVSVTDNNLCETVKSYTITQPDKIQINPTITNVLCNGDSTGQAVLNTFGGTFPYIEDWSGKNPLELKAGTYPVLITDSNLCNKLFNITINQPSKISISFDITSVNCNNGSDGAVNMTVMGGNPAYLYSWNDLNMFNDNSEDIEMLPIGNYYVTVTDANNCAYSDLAIIEEHTFNDTISQTICDGNSYILGSQTLTTTGIYTEPFVSIINGCDSTVTLNLTVDVCTGIKNQLVDDLKIYPNPTNNILNIEMPNTIETNIKMFDISGRIVLEQNFENKIQNIDVSKLSKGVYSIEINSKNSKYHKQIIIN